MSTTDPVRCGGAWHTQGRWGHGTGWSRDLAAVHVEIACPQQCGYIDACDLCDGRVNYGLRTSGVKPMECPSCHHVGPAAEFWTLTPLPVPTAPALTLDPAAKSQRRSPKPRKVEFEPTEQLDVLEVLTPSPAELRALYVRRLDATVSPGTRKRRLLTIDALFRRFPDVLAVSAGDLEQLKGERRRVVGPEALKSDQRAWVTFYDALRDAGHVPSNPASRLPGVRVPVVQGRIALDSQVRAGLALAAPDERAMILLGRYAGLRLSEIAGLRLEQHQGDTLRFKGKGGVVRRIAINRDVQQALDAIRAASRDGWYFPSPHGGALRADTVHKAIKRLTGTNPHSLRHAAATTAYAATRDVEAVRQMLGHSSLATTQRYLHVTDEQLRAVADATALAELEPQP